ncbi:MAG: hypothetical protein WKH64_09940 [Chloroflexia bacterium]
MSEGKVAERPPALFTGISTYQDPKGRYSIRYASDWNEFELSEERDGVMYAPPQTGDDPKTWLSIWCTELRTSVVAEDLDLLDAAFAEGLLQQQNLQIEETSNEVISDLIKLERVYTYEEDGAVRKRKTWVLYVGKWQIVLIWQGENSEEYEYWLPMVNYSLWSFNISPALWFATDRDLAGYGQQVVPPVPTADAAKQTPASPDPEDDQ